MFKSWFCKHSFSNLKMLGEIEVKEGKIVFAEFTCEKCKKKIIHTVLI